MFYLVDLLSHRRRGKLAPCWLAATLSQKLFKRHYNSDAIKKLDVIRISEEILKIIQQRGGARQRFSLYLSSQLLWGIIKIHQYQITCYQKDISMVLQTLDELSIEEDFDVVQILDITMELPVANENLLPDPSREDLHLLPEDVESQMMVRRL
ncbi:Meiotic recombination protein REC8-like protein [Ooceraea biroi]|uniref:Meiotic recombination protein REC8-like protein n=2 Tax=Ooceraea biroi TaxID=2015173 RepID=A0A026WF77_OOCBI|nr:Meiotic recombination protein REC8-like protein [Ooceraea biroi]